MKRILVTGTNRGLGLELFRQYAINGDFVIGTCRDQAAAVELRELQSLAPERLHILPFEASNPQECTRLAEQVAQITPSLDLLINNSGVFPRNDFHSVSAEEMVLAFRVNCLAPFLLTRGLAPLLSRSEAPVVVNISSLLGSVSLGATNEGWPEYAYGSSKAALNRVTRQLAKDLRKEGITVVAQNPGWVRTDMGGRNAPLSVQQSISAMRQVFQGLTLADSGRIVDLDGSDAPF